MHALIIEQDFWIVLMIEDALRDLGYASFTHASSWQAAIAAAEETCPDLVTSDIRLDVGNGIEIARAICSERAVPLVFVTATPWEVRAADSEAVVVPKPFGPARLKQGVERAIARPAC